MKTIQVKKYDPSQESAWDTFIASAKNGTFLFCRDFMEYHSDRFEDHSLMVYEGEKLSAVLPANVNGNTLISHQGLTYGGLILPFQIGFEKVYRLFQEILNYCKSQEIAFFEVKSIPECYHRIASFECEQLLIAKGAETVSSQLNFGIDYSKEINFHKSKLKNFRRGERNNMKIISGGFEDFWTEILIPRLSEKHDAEPVHTLTEITNLQKSFPENICQYSVYKDNLIVAGVTLFITDTVVKSQYGATSLLGEELRALDFLMVTLIEKYQKSGYSYFDQGTVIGGIDEAYNFGLIKQKEELGAVPYLQNTLKLQI